MSEVTVKHFAETIGVPVDRLLLQLKEAGVNVMGADDLLGDDDKVKLLDRLRHKHGAPSSEPVSEEEEAGPKKITLKRRTTSELKQTSTAAGKGKTVTVEVRKKRTYVKRAVVEGEEDTRRIEEDFTKRLEDQIQLEVQAKAAEAARRAEEETRRAEEEARRMAEEEARRAEEEARRMAEEKSRPAIAATAQAKPVAEAPRKAVEGAKPAKAGKPAAKSAKELEDERIAKAGKSAKGKGGEKNKSWERFDDDELHVSGGMAGRRNKKRVKAAVPGAPKHGFEKPTAPVVREVSIPETITVAD